MPLLEVLRVGRTTIHPDLSMEVPHWIPANRWLRCASVSVWLCFPSTQCEQEEPQPGLRHSTSSPCLPAYAASHIPQPGLHTGESGEPLDEQVYHQPV